MKKVLQAGGTESQKNDRLWPEAAVLFLLALAIRFVNLDHTALHDELYHVLAARSWLDQGVFAIDGGSYTRGSLFTMLVVVVYLWTHWSMGRLTALLASLFLIFSPLEIYLSQYARFYALQGLVFASAAFIFYFLVCSKSLNIAARTGLLVVVAVLLAVGVRLQVITLVGVAGMTLWFFCYTLYRCLQLPRNSVEVSPRLCRGTHLGLTYTTVARESSISAKRRRFTHERVSESEPYEVGL